MNLLSRPALSRLFVQEIERLQKAIEREQELCRPGAYAVGDEGDHAMSHADQGKHQTVVEYLKQLLSQVESARERLAAGTYGICEDCKHLIPTERLEALPYATLCVSCQSKRERGRAGRPRMAEAAR